MQPWPLPHPYVNWQSPPLFPWIYPNRLFSITLRVDTAASDMTEDDLITVNLFCAVALAWARRRVQLYVEQIDRQDRVMEVGAITGLFTDYNRAFDEFIPMYQRLIAAIRADLALTEAELRARRDAEEAMAGLY